ncbi:MAG: hypothetical protein EU539_03055 [Promethearchaeota archaeon]|nr:MAG: hypothetical protein EU539_03055 [Candidatus Lokiarchaeota archaeon]
MMINMLQNGENGGIPPQLLFVFFPAMFGLALILLKAGLALTKAEVRTTFKWVLASFGIQVGVFFFVGSPLMLLGFSGMMQGGPEFSLIIIFVIVALFLDVNVLNVTHQLGMKRALIVFFMMLIPFLFVVGFLIFLLTQVG